MPVLHYLHPRAAALRGAVPFVYVFLVPSRGDARGEGGHYHADGLFYAVGLHLSQRVLYEGVPVPHADIGLVLQPLAGKQLLYRLCLLYGGLQKRGLAPYELVSLLNLLHKLGRYLPVLDYVLYEGPHALYRVGAAEREQ